MKIENPVAFSYLLGNEVYLLASEKEAFKKEAIQLPEVPAVTLSFNCLGNNKKNFLVLTNYVDAEYIAPNHLIALENTLKRLGFELDDLAILNKAMYPAIVFKEMIAFFKPDKILFLGKAALPISQLVVPFNNIHQQDNTKILSTFSFDEMMDNTEKKKLFWELMKQL